MSKRRWLFYHPESSCYMEVFTEQEAEQLHGADGGLVVEVTGHEDHEAEFKASPQ